MKTTKGEVSASVYVECPHCTHEFDALEYDDEDNTLGLILFGSSDKPPEWNDANFEVQCPECCNCFMILTLEY